MVARRLPDLVVPLHHGARSHQLLIGPQPQVKLLPECRDVEVELLLGGGGAGGGRRLPLDTLLVRGGEQVRQEVSVRVGAEGSDEAVFLQPTLQVAWKGGGETLAVTDNSNTSASQFGPL